MRPKKMDPGMKKWIQGYACCVATLIVGHASNCTRPNDDIHKCRVRHGTPPMITVDKKGNTCEAGAGSIVMGEYHGFLINGSLTQC